MIDNFEWLVFKCMFLFVGLLPDAAPVSRSCLLSWVDVLLLCGDAQGHHNLESELSINSTSQSTQSPMLSLSGRDSNCRVADSDRLFTPPTISVPSLQVISTLVTTSHIYSWIFDQNLLKFSYFRNKTILKSTNFNRESVRDW